MADIFLCNSYIDSQQDPCKINFSNKTIKQQKSCTDLNFPIEVMNSTSLPNSPSRDNINTINNLLNSQDNSLSNSMDTIAREPQTAAIEFLSSNLDNSESVSSKSQSSFNNISLNNQKRKKSALFSGINNYRNKVINFKKNFSDSDASNDQLLGDYSCALAKSTHGLLIQGRLYVTEKWLCFYSKIMSFENKIILPISGITNVSKEKTAKVIPNAIQIITKTGKYFFTSFGSREKTFQVLQTLLNKHKSHEPLNNIQKKNLIHECYGSEADIYISEECNISQMCDNSENIPFKSSGEILRTEPPSFVVGDDSDSDTEQSLYSSNLNHPDEIGDHLSPIAKHRVKKNITRKLDASEDTNSNSNLNSPSLPSTNESNSIFRTSLTHNTAHICNNHDHFQKIFLDEEIDMHVDRLFSCLFTNSSFFRRFAEYRKTFDIIQAPWPEDCDVNGLKERTIYYTVTMKVKIGPKISTSEEKQIIHESSQPGYCYIVDTIVRSGGFPLSDCFHCINRYCLIHISAFKSKLKVTSQVVYDKSIFFASKSLIESTAKSGLTDYFNDLATSLKHEAKGLGQHLRQINANHSTGTQNLPKPTSRKLPNEPLHNQSRIHKSINDSNLSKRSDEFTLFVGNILRPDRAWLILIMLSLIICLCLSFLYSRFRQLEEMTNIEINRQNHMSRESSRFDSNYDWKLMLKKQQQIQMEELSQWKSLVDNSIDLIDQMRSVLVTIKSNLENLDEEIKSNSFHFDSKGKASQSS